VRRIHFRFDPEKAVAALTYLAQRVSDLDAMKSAKLLFFADRSHLRTYGRLILGDLYYGLEHGPVPTATYELIKQVFSQSIKDDDAEVAELLAEYLDVDRSGEYPRFVAKKDPDANTLSLSDIEVLDDTLRQLGRMSALELRQLAHEQPEIQYADKERARLRTGSVPIPLNLFFDEGSDAAMRRHVEDAQEDRDFAESLLW